MELKFAVLGSGNTTLFGSNRTFMELKLKCLRVIALFSSCSNRTFMELKSMFAFEYLRQMPRSNRTFMELKSSKRFF